MEERLGSSCEHVCCRAREHDSEATDTRHARCNRKLPERTGRGVRCVRLDAVHRYCHCDRVRACGVVHVEVESRTLRSTESCSQERSCRERYGRSRSGSRGDVPRSNLGCGRGPGRVNSCLHRMRTRASRHKGEYAGRCSSGIDVYLAGVSYTEHTANGIAVSRTWYVRCRTASIGHVSARILEEDFDRSVAASEVSSATWCCHIDVITY